MTTGFKWPDAPLEPALGIRANPGSPVVIATDGRRQSDGALAIGRILAHEFDAMRVVSVLPSLPSGPEAQIVTTPDTIAARRADTRRAALEQMKRVWRDACDLQIAEGDPALVIAGIAHRAAATMIVCGIGRHRVADRVFGAETALRIMRAADVPVLAATIDLGHAPRRIVVGVDFSETSLRAARMAIEVAAPYAVVYLLHVAPNRIHDAPSGDGKAEFRLSLSRVLAGGQVPKTVSVEHVVLYGDATNELLEFASSVDADLVALGSHGRRLLARMIVGSVAARVVRASPCSVLCVPRSAVVTVAD